eukprot:m.306010 g.306010  ORF g.306010 m.306010 type:complete len:532 (-) comp15914_c1_seq5:2488-4083(-)
MVDQVLLTHQAYSSILAHAHSTESLEVMGLLIGELRVKGSTSVSLITHAEILTRSDKRKDRVEISAAHQSQAAIKAERISKATKRNLTVLGWYHSHPHITVWPSHVDLRTQHQYQSLSSQWIGLIVACFQMTKAGAQHAAIIAFQSEFDAASSSFQRKLIPLIIQPASTLPSSPAPTLPIPMVRDAAISTDIDQIYQVFAETLKEAKIDYHSTIGGGVPSGSSRAARAAIHSASRFISGVSDAIHTIGEPLIRQLTVRLAQAKRCRQLLERTRQSSERVTSLEEAGVSTEAKAERNTSPPPRSTMEQDLDVSGEPSEDCESVQLGSLRSAGDVGEDTLGIDTVDSTIIVLSGTQEVAEADETRGDDQVDDDRDSPDDKGQAEGIKSNGVTRRSARGSVDSEHARQARLSATNPFMDEQSDDEGVAAQSRDPAAHDGRPVDEQQGHIGDTLQSGDIDNGQGKQEEETEAIRHTQHRESVSDVSHVRLIEQSTKKTTKLNASSAPLISPRRHSTNPFDDDEEGLQGSSDTDFA